MYKGDRIPRLSVHLEISSTHFSFDERQCSKPRARTALSTPDDSRDSKTDPRLGGGCLAAWRDISRTALASFLAENAMHKSDRPSWTALPQHDCDFIRHLAPRATMKTPSWRADMYGSRSANKAFMGPDEARYLGAQSATTGC